MKQSRNFCPIRDILDRLGDKWSIFVLLKLKENPQRFNDLYRNIPEISERMLAFTLKKLESFNLITRQAFAELPPHVEYSLTFAGRSLIPHIDALVHWAKDNKLTILR
ncbi:MAG: helix-turn-helix transcriptional regulator [Bacteroidales bacterium]|jgi:DNA-binding HxlR family transcriptional regulator|nr:helix-turn-helix transcriptional regulator [Bacteroidales bacterium]